MARRLSKSIQNEIRQITQEFVDQCVNTYRERIHTLRDEPDFVCDNHVRKRVCEPHIMYKLRNSDGLLALKGRNGRYYDFLVEFDPDDFAYGIYFGCRCALNEDDKLFTAQICSYVFMPYTLAKDTRTGYESGNIGAVMDGEIDGFINAYLQALANGTLGKASSDED